MMIQTHADAEQFVRHPGYSLLELVLVLGIMVILAAIAAPRYAGAASRYRAEGAARRIVADLELARTRARTYGSSQTVSFSVGANGYQMPGLPSLKDSSTPYCVTLSDPPYQATLLEVDFGGDETVNFDGWGVPDSGGWVTLRVGDIGRKVSLDRDTGKASSQ